ncbi:hypothetical protein OUZ56_017279 [Daphnia magna]|uniref:Uncharacterized protein n=1 Tax=Daphnia magna TaxID=35525 RepID=A0ABR0ASM5_9CRUS|nr:hypothetical protein OUZ56_017279 [Daphnia magna]
MLHCNARIPIVIVIMKMMVCLKIRKSTYSLKQLLQHFAAVTNQRKSHLSCLLRLLKDHQPEPDYVSLPSTGQQLMCIDSRDEVNHAFYRNKKTTPAHDSLARDTRAFKRKR